MVLSDRLEAVAELVKRAAAELVERAAGELMDGAATELVDRAAAEPADRAVGGGSTGLVIADIGTDHGYLAAALLDRGVAGRVIACDVNEGPLERAAKTLAGYEGAQVRLCDGLSGLKTGEADIAVMAGMGGRLMMRIIEEGDPRRLGIRAMVLQPQSEIYEFRMFLREHGFRISDERSVRDAGKFYQAMLAEVGTLVDAGTEVPRDSVDMSADVPQGSVDMSADVPKSLVDKGTRAVFDRYGQVGILRGDEALLEYIGQRIDKLRTIIAEVPEGDMTRLAELKQELDDTETAREMMLKAQRRSVL